VESPHHLRFIRPHAHLASPFGGGLFGVLAERIARFLGTPYYLVGQSLVVAAWIAINALRLVHFDLYPFILLNLAFSLQAAYAAPLILLAQTRQADRDKNWTNADAQHREEIARSTLAMLEQNTELTKQVKALSEHVQTLTAEIHQAICAPRTG